jgi:NAD(P)-dependent dehydrogenase (short-subunit alcohol dehydrogenase family)
MTRGPSVVITGSSTGIGAECALHLDRLGWRVFAGVRREEDGRRLAERASHRLTWLRLDVTDPATIREAVARVERETDGVLDGLVNNAGIAEGGPLEYLPLDRIRRQFDVNVFGLLAVTQAFLPLLRRAPGRIVNLGSVAGRVTSPMVGPYCASKRAVVAITDAFRLELAAWGLKVSVVEPGVILTPIWEKGEAARQAAEAEYPPEALERYGPFLVAFRRAIRGALKRGTSPEPVVRAVEHALTARRPRPRYLIGGDAKLRYALQVLLPVRWMDALVLAVFRRLARPR